MYRNKLKETQFITNNKNTQSSSFSFLPKSVASVWSHMWWLFMISSLVSFPSSFLSHSCIRCSASLLALSSTEELPESFNNSSPFNTLFKKRDDFYPRKTSNKEICLGFYEPASGSKTKVLLIKLISIII